MCLNRYLGTVGSLVLTYLEQLFIYAFIIHRIYLTRLSS